MTRTLEQLAHLSTVEDFFAFFGLTPDARVIERHRPAILRAWAIEVAEIDDATPPADEAERIALYRAALERTHEAFARGRGHLRLVRESRPCPTCPAK